MADSLVESDASRAVQSWLSDASLSPLGDGHIHDTFLAENKDQQLVLQRVNDVVFRDPDLVMAQTERLLACWSQQSTYRCPVLLPTKAGEPFLTLASGTWRAWSVIAGVTVDPATTIDQAHAAGCAFARLQTQLARIPGPPLRSTIEGFLDLTHYLELYEQVAEHTDATMRARVDAHRDLAMALRPGAAHIHGDCKINNLLFDASKTKVVAILDFDTAMSGHRAWDFGDLVRSVCASQSKVELDMFAACIEGFVAGGVNLSKDEAVGAPIYVTFMLALRFLTDHLSGDVYFKTQHAGENLERAEAQFALLDAFEEQRVALAEIAQRICDS